MWWSVRITNFFRWGLGYCHDDSQNERFLLGPWLFLTDSLFLDILSGAWRHEQEDHAEVYLMWPSVGLQETPKISLESKFVRMMSTATDGSLEEDMREDIWVRCGVYYGGGYY